jgi:putative membrane-bound dehydrogenase-like protein
MHACAMSNRFGMITDLLVVLLLLGSGAAAPAEILAPFNTERNTNGPIAAAEVVARTPLPDGFRLTVFAAEPDVRQPIAMATDPRGRLWVAENYTYSESRVGYHPQLRDRILVFEDTTGDGRFDRRAVFLDGLERLTSIEIGLGGVWVLALPQLWFVPDTDGDGVADGPPRVVLDGFEYERGRHTVANGLRWGPDGWLYARHGIQSTSLIGPPGAPESERTAMNVGIWRYHPTRRVTEVVAQGTTNPWGMDWDARGELFFINTVIGHLWHVIPGAHYRRMYGADPTPNIYEVIEQHADHVHWARDEVWNDVARGLSDVTSAAGGGHAHTGLLIYQGAQWPAAWNDKLLTINFHGRRLNVERLERQGSGFVGRHEPDAFFFADPWFRGIDLIAAPDGGVFVSDWSDTGECHDHDGIHRTSGRIYKLTYGNSPASAPTDLTALAELELTRLQTSANDWLTRQARRVLADRAAHGQPLTAARAALARMAATHGDEVVRLRAVWGLHVSGGVDHGLLRAKLERGTEPERAWALRLLEDARHASSAASTAFDRLVEQELPGLAAAEPSAFVRLTFASLLQKLELSQRPALAAALLARAEDADDHNLPLMLWYGIEPLARSEAPFVDLIAQARIPRVQRLGARRLAQGIQDAPDQVDALLTAIAIHPSTATRRAVLDGLAQGFIGRRQVPVPASWTAVEARFVEGADELLLARLHELSALFGDGQALDQIRKVAFDAGADLPQRRAALQALIDARADGLRQVCEQLLSVRDLAATAAAGLALFDDPRVAARLLAEWPRLHGHERAPVLNALLSRPAWAARLLDAMAAGLVRRADLGVAQARQIRGFNQSDLTARLTEVWGALHDPDETTRAEALTAWRERLTPEALAEANLAAGRQVYAVACGPCHQLYGEGGDLGPDLTGSGRHNLDYLLEHILFPNAVVPADFRQTTLELRDGRILSGVVTGRTQQAITLSMIGETVTLGRSDIETEDISELSMMPEGLIEALTETEVRDLMAYLMSTAPPIP